MSERTAPPCPHDVGPGIHVCLRCRQERRAASRDRRRRAFYATSAILLGIGVLGAAGAAGMLDSELRAAGIVLPPEPMVPAAYIAPVLAVPEPANVAVPEPANVEVAVAQVSVRPETTVTSVASVTTPPAPELAPVIGEGRTELRAGIFAERADDEITVHFDNPLNRTRRPEKFETILRATLPQIYGPGLDSALTAMPPGSLVPPQGLTTELPTQGLYLPLPGGPTLRIWPETRRGEDGPLVVRYRVLSSF